MPLRSLPSTLWSHRSFHTSSVLRAVLQNHYEILQIPPNATPSEVKKSFYALSKTHHPDRNPNDPSASQRFVQISEAYTILGTPAKRQQYDRDFLRAEQAQSHAQRAEHHGSYHSSGPVGGRPASGLSKRRTQFRGPPPSFFRSGGWGEHNAKRQAAQDSGTKHSHSGPETAYSGQTGRRGGEPGMGPGQQPWGHDEIYDVPHFDREQHYRTHMNQDKRRRRRRTEDYISRNTPPGTMTNFLIVGGTIALAFLVPKFVYEKLTRKPKAIK